MQDMKKCKNYNLFNTFDNTRKKIFFAMSQDMGVVIGEGLTDDEIILELYNADDEIIKEYAQTFLED